MSPAAVVLPTYNEAGNLEGIVSRIRRLADPPDVIVVDDASPDGTGEMADRLAAADPGVFVLHRSGKSGLGAAYAAGFAAALGRGYEPIAQMDADGSHQPEELGRLMDVARAGRVAVGSRNVAGGHIRNWERWRVWLSRAGSGYVRRACAIGVRDATSGFRAWPRACLEAVHPGSVRASGYAFQIEMLLRALDAGCVVEERPITFVEREAGRSKMTGGIIAEALWRVTVWGARRRVRGLVPHRRPEGRRARSAR